MIPILYEGNETAFTSNGLGRLADAISCKVVEERNATYELEMTYPISGVHYDDLAENRIILAKPFDGGTPQPFIIYKITRPLNGKVTVNAEHISYRLSGYTVMPFTANSCVSALAGLKSNSAVTNPFTFSTDKTTAGNFSVTVPTNARELLCGSQGSILDVYGKGDYEFSFFNVKLWQNRGADNHVTLRYGKNITDLKSVLDMTGVYTGIVPYWTDGGAQVKTLPEKAVLSDYAASFPFIILKPVDFSQRWDNEPTDATMRTAAQNYLSSNEGWKLKNNITVSFVALWGTEEYKDIAPLERVKMCDVVKVVYSKLGIDFSTRVVKTDYNVLQERYNAITLGDTYYSLSQVFNEEIQNSQQEQMTYFQKAIAHGTALITGGLGGYVYLKPNANGQPEEILIMDKPDIAQSVRMIRMNKNGIGFSDNGYNGPFNTAWTIENNTGHFYAEYIDAGTFNANLIQAGKIQPIVNGVASANYWDMLTGKFHLSSTVQVDNSTIASKSNVATAKNEAINDAATATASAIQQYDGALNQQKVFNKLTNNGTAQGITMTADGNLYVNATWINTGILSGGGDGQGNYKFALNMSTGHVSMKDGDFTGSISASSISGSSISGTSITGGTISGGTITGETITGSTISGNTITGGTISGGTITGETITGSSISGTSITGGTISGGTITGETITGSSISSTSITGGTISGGTITGETITGSTISGTDIIGNAIKTANSGERIEMDTTSSIMGYNAGGMHNLLNMMQTGTTQMTIDADTQLNIRTPHVYITDQSAGTGSATVYGTQTDSLADFQDQTFDTGRLCYRILDVRKLMPADDPTGQTYHMQELEIKGVGQGQGDVRCTLPVFLKFRYKNERRMHGMVLSGTTADSFVV